MFISILFFYSDFFTNIVMLDRNLQKNTLVDKLQYNLSKNKTKIDSTFSTAQSIENAPYFNNAITPFYQKKEENTTEVVYSKTGDKINIGDTGTVYKANVPIMNISLDGFYKEDLPEDYLDIADDNIYLKKIEDGKILFKYNEIEETITYSYQYNIQTARIRVLEDKPVIGVIFYNPLDNNHYYLTAIYDDNELKTKTNVIKWHWNDPDECGVRASAGKQHIGDWQTTSEIQFDLTDEEANSYKSTIRNAQPLLQITSISAQKTTPSTPGEYEDSGNAFIWCLCLNTGVQSNKLFATELIGYSDASNMWFDNSKNNLEVFGNVNTTTQAIDVTISGTLTFKAILAVEAPNYHVDSGGNNETYEYITAGSYVKVWYKVESWLPEAVGIPQPSLTFNMDYSYPPLNNGTYDYSSYNGAYNGNNLLVKYGHWHYNNGNYETVQGSNKNNAFGTKHYDYNEIEGLNNIPYLTIAKGETPDRSWHNVQTAPLEYGVMLAIYKGAYTTIRNAEEYQDYISKTTLKLTNNNNELFTVLGRARNKPKITSISIRTDAGSVTLTEQDLGSAATSNTFVFSDIGSNSITTASSSLGQALDEFFVASYFSNNKRLYANNTSPFENDSYKQNWYIGYLNAGSAEWQAKSHMDNYCSYLEQRITNSSNFTYAPYWIWSDYLNKTAPFKDQFNDLITLTPSEVRAEDSNVTTRSAAIQNITANVNTYKQETINYDYQQPAILKLRYIDDNGNMLITASPSWNYRPKWGHSYTQKEGDNTKYILHYKPKMFIMGAKATGARYGVKGGSDPSYSPMYIDLTIENNSYVNLVPYVEEEQTVSPDPTFTDPAIYRYFKDITREVYQGVASATINFTAPNTEYAHPDDPSEGSDWNDTDPWYYIYYDTSTKKMLVNTGVTKADDWTTYEGSTYKTPAYYHNTNKIAQYGNWRLIYNTGVGLSNISYSEDDSKIGTILADWFSIKKVEISNNKLFYQDTEGNWHKIEIRNEGIKKQKIILDKYIIFNTTSFNNCYDLDNNKILHACSDWNNRITFGGSAGNGNWGVTSNAIKKSNKTVLVGSGIAEQYTFGEEKDFPAAIFNPVVENYFCNDFNNFITSGAVGQDINIYTNISDYSSLAYYYNTLKNGNLLYIKDYLRDITFPTTQSGSVYLNFNLFSEYKQSYCNFDYVKNDNSYYFTLYANNKNFPLYNLTGGLKNLKGFFVLQGLYYAIYEDYITSLERAGFVITNETVVTSIRGMKYVGFTEESAYFFSPTDKSLFSFIPNNSLKKVAIFTEINDITNTYYDVAKKWIIWKTDKGLYVYEALNDYIFKLSDTNNVETVYSTYDDLIVKDNDYTNRLYRLIKTDDYALLPYNIKTSYYGAGQNKAGKISSINMTFDDTEEDERYVNISSSTISDKIVETPVKRYGKEPIINHNVKDYNGRGVSFTLEGTLPINEIAVDFNSVGNTQKIINNKQEIR